VFARVVHGDGAERAQPDMERERDAPHAGRLERRKQRFGKVQPRGGRGHGAVHARVDRLVAHDVLRGGRVMDVRRQRHLALRTQRGVERATRDPHDALALIACRDHHDRERSIRRREPRPDGCVLRGLREHAPALPRARLGTHEQQLQATARRPPHHQARGPDACLVHHEHVAGTKPAPDACEPRVVERARGPLGDEQLRVLAPCRRVLRDQLPWQLVVEHPHEPRGVGLLRHAPGH